MNIFFITQGWSGLHNMFETENWGALAGVPLVPLYWKYLAAKGHHVCVIVTGDFTSDKDFQLEGINFYRRKVPRWLLGGVKGRPVQTYFKLGWMCYSYKTYKTVMKIGETVKPDVIYSYDPGYVWVGHLLARRFKVPHIAHFWGTWLGHYIFNEPWYKRIRVIMRILAFKVPLDLLVISNDGTLGDKVANKLGFPMDKLRFWLDGTSPGIYQPDLDKAEIKRSVGIEPTDKMIFQVARLDFWKRIDRTIAAMPEVLKRVPNARLVVAGDGNLRKDLEKQVNELGVSDAVKFLGFVPHERVMKLHNAADLFVTVQDLTNLGNQILEALHSGTCIVAYNNGATSDVMVDGETGVLLDEDGLSRLGDVIADLLLDDRRREELAKGALAFARKNIWTWDQRMQAEEKEVQRLVYENRKKMGILL
jgi:glycosyltransferase involved in cell wall biosynthesis